MKVSVIIPTKNPGWIFERVLDRVLAQQTPWPYEVLVVDSGSMDGTPQYVQAIPDRRLHLHCIEATAFGHGRTRNLGVSLTSGEYAVLITHDALPADEHWLRRLVVPADVDPMVAGVFGRHLAYPEASPFTKRELEMHFEGFTREPVVCLADRERYERDQGYRQYLHYFSDNNALVRRSVWERIPYPDVDFAEDQIWAQKIIEAGYRKAYAHDAAVYHSHDYALWERLQRSFDEARAFRQLFGYELCRGFGPMLRSWLGLSLRDMHHAAQTGLLARRPMAALRAPFDNLMRVAGHFLGARAHRLPDRISRRMSRDKRLMSGVLVGKK